MLLFFVRSRAPRRDSRGHVARVRRNDDDDYYNVYSLARLFNIPRWSAGYLDNFLHPLLRATPRLTALILACVTLLQFLSCILHRSAYRLQRVRPR